MRTLAFCLAVAGCATPTVQQPPQNFRGDASVMAHVVTSDTQRETICRLAGAPGNSLACANEHILIMPNPCSYNNEFFASVICHELGHVNGWPPEHPE